MVNLTIDGRAIQAKPGSTILEVAKENGIFIPYLCYHPALKPIGSCRICVVDVKPGPPRPIPACATPVTEGMEVVTDTPKLAALRQELMKLVLINHALECPICDKGGECELQNLTHALARTHGGPGGGQAAAQSGLRLPDGGAPPGPLRHLRPLRPHLPGPGGGHGHQLHAAGLLHGTGQRRPAPGLRVLRLLHRHLPGGGPDQQAVQVPGPGLGRGQDRDGLPLLRRRLHLPACTPKTARSCGW